VPYLSVSAVVIHYQEALFLFCILAFWLQTNKPVSISSVSTFTFRSPTSVGLETFVDARAQYFEIAQIIPPTVIHAHTHNHKGRLVHISALKTNVKLPYSGWSVGWVLTFLPKAVSPYRW